MSLDVYSLSDAELASLLHQHGATCGPIIDQTRLVYQKKLQRLLAGDSRAEDPAEDSGSEDEDDGIKEADDDWPAASPPKPEYGDSLRSRYQGPRSYESRGPAAGTIPFQSYERRPVQSSYSGSSAPAKPAAQPAQSGVAAVPAKRPVPLWLQLTLLAVVLLVVYLILRNMEPAYSPPALRANSD